MTLVPESFFLHLPRKMEPIEGSETSAFKPQTPGKYPKEKYYIWFVFLTDYHMVIKSGKLHERGKLQVGMRGEEHTEFWWRILR